MPSSNPLLDAAVSYAGSRLAVFPANPSTKAPLTEHGMKDATTDVDQIVEWWTRWPNALVACRVPDNRVVIDVDPRHGGDATWAELQRTFGPITSSRTHASGRGDGGEHHWFDRPEGKLTAKKLHDFAREHGTGHETGKRGWTSGLDLLHYDHRYSILPPSPHPDTGLPYRWLAQRAPGPMPKFLAELVVADPPQPPPPKLRQVRDADSIADWYTANHTWNEILEPAGWVLVSGGGDEDGSKWRHPNASAESSASIRHGCLFVYSDNTDFDTTEQGDPAGYTRFKAWSILEHNEDMAAAAREARELKDGPSTRRHVSTPQHVDTTTGEITQASWTNLPDEFWTARPVLQHLRQAAHCRGRCADAVLLFTLARVAAITPPTVVLPPIVGGRASLNFLGGIVSSSGGGKTTAGDVARDLLPIDRTDVVADVPPGSGEGLTELFFEFVNEEDAEGKKRKVKRQTKTGALIYLDEGEALAEMGNRKGATLMPTLRSAWSGAVIGQSNASQETHRVLAAHKYRLAIMVGFQVEFAAEMIADATGGTPQRFVFARATDPTIPDDAPEWPGALEIHVPAMVSSGTVIEFDPDVAAEIGLRARMAARGEYVPDPLDTHRDLVRMKVAALLARLEDRLCVTAEDWELAGVVMKVSTAIRSGAIEVARRHAEEHEQSYATKLARRALVADDTAEQRALVSGSKSIARRIHKVNESISVAAAKRAVAGKHRDLASVDDMLAYAESQGWLVADGELWKPGDSRPA